MNVACFPAIGTVIFSISAQADPFEPLAVTAVAVADALPLWFVALHAQRYGSHDFFILTVAAVFGTASNDYRSALLAGTSRHCRAAQQLLLSCSENVEPLLRSEILNMNVLAQPDVISEIPAGMVGIVVNHDIVAAPVPAIGVAIVVGGHTEIKTTEPETVTASPFNPVNMVAADFAPEVSVFPGMINMIVGITAA